MDKIIGLPKPSFKGSMSVEEAIKKRRTVRDFSSRSLTIEHLSQILWAAQGITGERINFRSAPSAGIMYPLDVYMVIGQDAVKTLPAGVYRYLPKDHILERLTEGDRRSEVAQAAYGQLWMTKAPVLLVISAECERLMGQYGEKAVRYAELEAGHAGQNVFLQAEASGLSAGIVGVSDTPEIVRILGSPEGEEPISIIPLGYRN